MRVSAICTSYNKEAYLSEALQGIVSQECSCELEVIVLDDCSSDGSPDIIRDYMERYPSQLRAVFHEQNLGLPRTWVEGCSLATGDYIARCDADDYWSDPHKIEKQLALLMGSDGARWSSTDFDIINLAGELVQPCAIANGTIRAMRSLEDMVAYKGTTNSSTWLVEHALQCEVNELLDPDVVDDSFKMQLELFQRTNLAFLEDSTTAYRLGDETDSHSRSLDKMQPRILKLKSIQLEYAGLDVVNQRALATKLIDESNAMEIAFYAEREKVGNLERLLASEREELAASRQQLEDVQNSRRWRLASRIASVFGR